MRTRMLPPLWLMGLTNATYGMYIGFCAAGLPILLAGQHVAEAKIATVTAVVLSPMFWGFLLGPVLDVRLSRRTYAAVFAVMSAALLALGLVNASRLQMLAALLMLGTLTVSLSQYALGGWLVSLDAREDETRLSAWFNVANIGGAGVMVLAAGELTQRLPLGITAAAMAMLLLLPMVVFPMLPAPRPGLRLAGESFGRFFGEVYALLRKREVLLALAIFVAPCASFAMTNVLAGLGADYHATEQYVSRVAGLGTVIAGVSASLLLPVLARGIRLRWLYLLVGVVGAVFTLGMLLLPRTPESFAVAMIGETFFQTLAIANAFALQFEIVGPENPLASTMLAVLGSAMNLPMTYMVYVDGRVYARHGLRGSFGVDAACGLVACVALVFFLRRMGRGSERA